jgi:GntR family transcriptional regulator, transcriptional repressor for pyruvate dehydrogenase complex
MFREVQQNKVALDIIRQVRESILEGKLRPGDRLPPEKELVTKFGVSKHSLREAFRALEAMGFLSIRKGSSGGAVVLEMDMKVTRDSIFNFLYFQNVSVQDLSEVRRIFEPHLTRLAVNSMAPEALEKLAVTHECCRETLSRGENIYRHEIEFHRVLAQATGNPVFVLIQDFVNSLLGDLKRQLRPGLGFLQQVLAAHDRILTAVRAGDSERAAQEMYRHVCEVEDGLEAIRTQQIEGVKGRVTARGRSFNEE